MKIASYNVEWMSSLFWDGKINPSDEPSSRHNITRAEQLDAVAKVLRFVDADGYLILEAPNEYKQGATKSSLEDMARHFGLRQTSAILGAKSGTDQEIAFLYDPEKLEARYAPHKGPKPPKFTDEIKLSIDEDHKQSYRFSKPPLELQIQCRKSGDTLTLIGAHFKTKAPHGAHNDKEVREFGLTNRRKQIAQALWLRARVDQIDTPLIVAGDFNDGPGLDTLEKVIGQSSIDILTRGGALWDPALKAPIGTTTSRFFSRHDHTFKEALIDFAFVNPQMRPNVKDWEIWHPFQNKRLSTISDWQEALLTASDHFPVAIEFE